MANPTMLRSKEIGKYLGIAIGCDDARGHSAHFQLYMKLGGGLILMRSDYFESDASAEAMFADWVNEAELLAKLGDM